MRVFSIENIYITDQDSWESLWLQGDQTNQS